MSKRNRSGLAQADPWDDLPEDLLKRMKKLGLRLPKQRGPIVLDFAPIKLRGEGPTASEMLLVDRER